MRVLAPKSGAAEPHIHRDTEVTRSRLDAFAVAPRAEQVRVLATLRAHAADESDTALRELVGILLATLMAILAPFVALNVDEQLRGNPIFLAVLALAVGTVLLIAFLPAMIDMARDLNRRERATVWLGAFQDELARRHRLKGRAARRWQRDH